MKSELHEYSKTAKKSSKGEVKVTVKNSFSISEPKPETIKILRNRLKNEVELYEFVKDLFYEKLKSFAANEI